MESDLLFEEAPFLKLTTIGRKSRLKRTVQLWFAYADGRIFFLAHRGSQWWKNLSANPKVEVDVLEVAFKGIGRLASDNRDRIYDLFRSKYGGDQVDRWYGRGSKRQAVEVEVGRVIGKRPEPPPPLEPLVSIQ